MASTAEGAVHVSAVDARIRGLWANLDVPKMLQNGHQEERPVAGRGALVERHPGTHKHRFSSLYSQSLDESFGTKKQTGC